MFPKGLVRYQYNPDSQTPALAIAAFGSSNPESVSIPNAVFNTGIDDIVLAKSFKTNGRNYRVFWVDYVSCLPFH